MLKKLTILMGALLLIVAGPAFGQNDTRPRYTLNVTVDTAGKKLSAQEKVVFVNTGTNALNELFFHVYPNRVYSSSEKKLLSRYSAYFKVNVFPDGFPRDLFLLRTLQIQGQDAVYQWEGKDRTLLKVTLPQALAPGQKVEVDLAFELRLPHAYSRFGWRENIIKLSQWYPVLAAYDTQGWHQYPFYPFHRPFFSQSAYFAVALTVPGDEVVAHTGETLSETPLSDGKKTVRIETLFPVRDFTVAMSPDYKVVTGDFQGVKIKSFYLPGDESSAQAAIANVRSLMEYYTPRFGVYPYKEFSVVPVPLGYGGEQMSNLVFIDTRAYKLPGFLHRYFDFLVAHETGHQWFYNTVGVDEFRQMWLEEGVNSYFVLKYLENKYGGRGASIVDYPKWAKSGDWLLPQLTFHQTRDYSYKRMVRVGYGTQPVLSELSQFREPSSIFFLAYGKGARIVGMLEQELGSAVFERVFKRVTTEYRFANLDIKDFQAICEQESGKELSWFFDQWLLSSGYWDAAVMVVKGNTITLARRGAIQVPVKVKVRLKSGAEQEFVWDGKKAVDQVVIASASAIASVAVDPNDELLDIDRVNNFWPRQLVFKPVPLYVGLYDMALFQQQDAYNVIVGPEVANSGVGVKASIQRPFDQSLYAGTDYEFGAGQLHSRAGYLLKNVFRSQTALGFEVADRKDWKDKKEDLVSGKVFLRRELWPVAYSFSEVNDHATLYVIRNQRLSDHPESMDYRENDQALEYSRHEESIVGAAVKLSSSGPYPDPVSGAQVQGWLENAGHFWGATQYFYRSGVDTSYYQLVTRQSRLALRVKYGWGYPSDKDLYQLGGMNDLRGYDHKSFRGANMLLGGAEYRFPLKEGLKWSWFDHILGVEAVNGVVFFDNGNTWFANMNDGKWKKDVGAGLRFVVNIGSMLEKMVVRLDAAYPLNGTDKEPHFWFGVNHAF